MRSFKLSVAAILSATVLAGAANSAQIVNLTGASSYVDLTTASDKNLSNNGSYSSGSGKSAVAYIFGEGEYAAASNPTTSVLGIAGETVQSFLLHYDRANTRLAGPLALGSASGSFQIQLDPGEIFKGLVGYTGNPLDSFNNAFDLTATDPAISGAIFPITTFTTFLFRGTEGNLLGDKITLSSPFANIVQVDYDLSATGASLDETRFFIQSAPGAVPEPAAWAMMIGGFGMVGGVMRARRSKAAVHFA